MLDPMPLLEQLISINSVNPSLVPGAPGEKEIATFVKNWCEQQSLEVQWLESESRPSLIIRAKGKGHGKILLLNAHMDTVGVKGITDPFEPKYDGKHLYARGALDMKSGLAACMVAIAKAQALNLSGDVILTAVANEESESIGTAQVLELLHMDAAIVTEPTQLQAHIAHRGFAVFEIKTQGKASHTSQPHLGINAITQMGKILAEVEKVQQRLEAVLPHPLLGHGLLQAVLIQGGQELFTTPPRCTLHLERRSLPGETKETLESEICEILKRAQQKDVTLNPSYKTLLYREPYEVSEQSDIVQLVQRRLKARGLDDTLGGAPYWMDSALIAAKGIPTVIFGPSGGGIHAVDEWVDVDSVQVCAEVLLEVIKDFCK
jgi:acetylornithine deacetylase